MSTNSSTPSASRASAMARRAPAESGRCSTRQQITGTPRAAGRPLSAPRKSNMRESSKRTLQMTRTTPRSTCSSASDTDSAPTSSACSPSTSRTEAMLWRVPATNTRGLGSMHEPYPRDRLAVKQRRFSFRPPSPLVGQGQRVQVARARRGIVDPLAQQAAAVDDIDRPPAVVLVGEVAPQLVLRPQPAQRLEREGHQPPGPERGVVVGRVLDMDLQPGAQLAGMLVESRLEPAFA